MEAVAADESILRRVHRNHCNLSLPQPILLAAFRPSKMDSAGLSVYREKYLTPQELANTGRKSGEYYVVRLTVSALHPLGLTVVADEQAEGPAGHALIPELSLAAYEGNREVWKIVLEQLAGLASQDIVHWPTPA